ncbi:MAG TPA: tetratricopeptide repeat protein [Bryobacteraceae bacterium]|nr:tetratricopeptide repeat protein [Bryobacteraceae bacterium]
MVTRCVLLLSVYGCLAAAQDTVPPAAPAIPPPPPDIPALMRSGDAKYLKGDYDGARQDFLDAWNLAQAAPPEDPARYDVLKKLTSVRAAAGEFEDANNYLQMAIQWRESTLGKDDPKIADDLLESVTLLRGLKDYGHALTVMSQVMAMHMKESKFLSVVVADDFSRFAQIQMEYQKPEDATGSLQTALSIRTQMGGPLDPSLVYDLDRLGTVYIALRQYDKAEEAYRHALVIRESLYGKDNADLISTVDGLAYACFGQKKYDEAEPIYQRLVALWIKSVGPEHPVVAMTLDKVATFYAEQKKFDQAKEASERANAIRTHFLATGLTEEATEQLAEGNKSDALALYQRALKVMDPPNPAYDELRSDTQNIVKSFAPAAVKLQKKTSAAGRGASSQPAPPKKP